MVFFRFSMFDRTRKRKTKPTKHNLVNKPRAALGNFPHFDEVEMEAAREKELKESRKKLPMSLSSSSTSISSHSFSVNFWRCYQARGRWRRKTKFRQAAEYINININGPTRSVRLSNKRGKWMSAIILLNFCFGFSLKRSGRRNVVGKFSSSIFITFVL